jgi:hypothetical protein
MTLRTIHQKATDTTEIDMPTGDMTKMASLYGLETQTINQTQWCGKYP